MINVECDFEKESGREYTSPKKKSLRKFLCADPFDDRIKAFIESGMDSN